MSNRVTISAEFSFKGQQLTPTCELDLDDIVSEDGQLPDLYMLLANNNNIGLYSYEYEMLQSEPVIFSNAQGIIRDFIHDGELDVAGFEKAWKEQRIYSRLQAIANRQLGIDDLQQNPSIAQALLDAYQLGKEDAC